MRKPPNYWTFERCQTEAFKCTRETFKRDFSSAYQAAKRNKWTLKFKHTTKSNKGRYLKGYWTFERVKSMIDEDCFLRTHLFKKSKGAYNAALRNGWLDILFPFK